MQWSKDAIGTAHDNLLLAAKSIPDGAEYADVRTAMYRALDRLRQARGAITAAYNQTVEAMLVAERAPAVPITDARAMTRYSSKPSANGAQLVTNARRDRAQCEASYAERQRQKQEQERQDFLNNRTNTLKKGNRRHEDQD
ncbi:MAG: hypothetical protein H7Z42_10280 [Roseiflexaceae bacterium]|nr:hypothetical protein [Roseiflexaceae bacterium]